MAGYSPRIVSSVPMAGDTVAPTATLFVTFDVNVAGVSTSSFGVFVRSTQTILPGTVSYDGGSKTATWSTPGGMPPNEQLNMVLSQDIFDPATTNALMELPIAFATGP